MSKIIEKAIYVAIGALAVLLLFAICKKEAPPQSFQVRFDGARIRTVIDLAKAVVKIHDKDAWPKHYVIITEHDTIPVDSAMPYGDVPVVETTFDVDTTLAFKINNREYTKNMSATVSMIHKGEVFEHTFWLHPTEFSVDIPQDEKTVRLFGAVGLGYGDCVLGQAELGFIIKDRFSISGMVIHADEWHYGVMARAWF
jgi:hypothetical protein